MTDENPDEDFWHTYLRYHRKPATRMLHYIASGIFAVSLVFCIITANLLCLLPGLFLWVTLHMISHGLIERSPTLMSHHPISCFICSFRMAFSALTGHIREDLTGMPPPRDH